MNLSTATPVSPPEQDGPGPTLSALEIASGAVLGQVTWGTVRFTPEPPRAASPLTALENAVLPALLRPPCLVSFSGGLDSSFVLAVATRAARRFGLADPVPVTWRFTGAPRADETSWQDRVLRDLGIGNRVLLATDDLDFVGPVAARFLRRDGVRYPANLYLHEPLLQQAAGGSLLTGLGGDQILSCWSVPARRKRSGLRGRLPLRLRQYGGLRTRSATFPWLRHPVARQLILRRRWDLLSQPAEPGARLAWRAGRRSLQMTADNLSTLGSHHQVTVVNPLLDSSFHQALVASIDTHPLPAARRGRADVLARVAGDALPATVFQPREKALFGEVFLRRYTRDLVHHLTVEGGIERLLDSPGSEWDATGIGELIDPARLRTQWSPTPATTTTAMLLQSAWLASRRTE